MPASEISTTDNIDISSGRLGLVEPKISMLEMINLYEIACRLVA